jgi:calcineurin-like phosphoesterase family protein
MIRLKITTDPSKVFFTSDTHFGHDNIIKYCNRPFKSSKEDMDSILIKNIVETVPHDGVLFHLGDFSFKDPEPYLSRIDRKIIRIAGNHDHKTWSDTDMIELQMDGNFIVMSHYPMLSWNRQYHGSWHLFGHCHGNTNKFIFNNMPYSRLLDVGVDSFNYRPVSYEQLKSHFLSLPTQGILR